MFNKDNNHDINWPIASRSIARPAWKFYLGLIGASIHGSTKTTTKIFIEQHWRWKGQNNLHEVPLPDQPQYLSKLFVGLQRWPKTISYLLFLVYRHVKPNDQMKYFLGDCLIIDITTCMRHKVFAVPRRMEERFKSIFISFSMGIIKDLFHQIFKLICLSIL